MYLVPSQHDHTSHTGHIQTFQIAYRLQRSWIMLSETHLSCILACACVTAHVLAALVGCGALRGSKLARVVAPAVRVLYYPY